MKRILILVVTLALLAGLCVPVSMAMAEDRALEGNTYVTGLPIVKEPITLRIACLRHTLDKTESFNEKAIFQKAAEETGINIEWIELQSGTEVERVNIMLASDLPDIFYGGLLQEDHIAKSKDSFFDLAAEEGFIEKWAPHIFEQYKEIDDIWEMLSFPGGHIYSLATAMQTSYDNDAEGVTFINKKWLDDLGLAMPTNTDEFYEVLVAFRDNDPNGDGLKNEIPLEFCRNNWAAHILNNANPWGIAGRGAEDRQAYYRVEDGKFVPNINTQAFRDFLTYYHKLAKEGLIDVEGFSQTNQQYYAKLKEYVVGVYSGWTPDSNLDATRAAEYVAMPPIEVPGMEGQQQKHGELDRFRGVRLGFAITSACKEPEAALRWFDYLASSTELKYLSRYGEEGILWERDDEGNVWTIFPENLTEDFTRENMKYTYGMVDRGPMILKSEMEQNDGEKYPASVKRAGYVDVVAPYFQTEFLPTRFVDPDVKRELNFIESEINTYMEGFIAGAITTGEGLDDAGWAAHLAQLDALDIAGWVQWYQDFIDGKF